MKPEWSRQKDEKGENTWRGKRKEERFKEGGRAILNDGGFKEFPAAGDANFSGVYPFIPPKPKSGRVSKNHHVIAHRGLHFLTHVQIPEK